MKYLYLLLIVNTIVFYSCSSDDESSDSVIPDNNDPYEVNFIEQDLQGTIEGESWTYKGGTVSTNKFTGDSVFTSFISIGTEEFDTSGFCQLNNPDQTPYILFTMKHASKALEPTAEDLSLDFTLENNYTITFVSFNDTATGPFNRIITQGRVEVLSVDTVAKIVTGRIDARDLVEGDANNVNGNFSISYCNF